ncbi:L-threonine O-3-phosphate decarboxylase [Halanaerobium saccharolyticum]|uniref:threonine-phosphate decarboxylase n=1 Tax=Halanaerobium saccharolyticum TaxID=43595 RepID=A0A4R7Z9R1_9FIRM|nr:threonine-phosphate decarboxylase CobD [Halanaerobium saccharolyticum]RAK10574.1 L-threonine O-3-phosphate decarboxylase [Halanaerobium saccharolyticum]TDW06669.1 L-threonine O-3-phosphate decarboxylase [Halanaerobium saccharolyticum]TDX62304.1 L-threonine O-3-phosphate decarboxylase [Halanaerobium saccharolyticum]
MEHQHGGKLIEAAQKNNLDQDQIIDFSANINFLGPPTLIKEAIRANVSKIENYPEINSKTVKRLIAEKHGLEPGQVAVANGAAEMIYQLNKVLKPEQIMVIDPTFSEYELAAESVGAEIKHFQLRSSADFVLDLETLKADINGKIDLLFICNPNNPTAHLIKADKLEAVIQKAAAENAIVVLDEAFIDFLTEPDKYSAIKFLNSYDNLVILKSLTKLFAIPGLRLGYALTNKTLSLELEAKRDPWSVNYFSQLAGEIIFSSKQEIVDYVNLSRKKIAAERNFLYQKLKQFKKLKVYRPTTNYIFIDISETTYSSAELKQELIRSAILIRNCDSYQGLQDNYIRVAVKARKENEMLIERLKHILD